MVFLRTFCTIVLIAMAFLVGCGKRDEKSPAMKRGSQETFILEGTDAEMNDAIREARSTLDEFTAAFRLRQVDHSGYALKVMYPDQVGGHEHVWITDLSLEDGVFSGIVGNVPEYTIEVEAGQYVTVNPEAISDWMYLDGGVLRGGYTLRVLYNRMSPGLRKEFETNSGFVIEE